MIKTHLLRIKRFWISAGIRAGRTFLVVFSSMFLSLNQLSESVPYLHALSAAGLAAVLSVLTSLVGLPELAPDKEPKWLAVGMRTTKTLAQTMVSLIPVTAIYLQEIAWLEVLQVSMTAAVGSLLLGLLSLLPEETGTSSLMREAR